MNERGPAQEAGWIFTLPEENIYCQTIILSRLTVAEAVKTRLSLDTIGHSHPLNRRKKHQWEFCCRSDL